MAELQQRLKLSLTEASFLQDVALEHGPIPLLGRFLLAADTACRARGVALKCASFDDLVSVNRANRDTWRPLLPHYDPTCVSINADNALCILGHNEHGEVVLTQVARFFDWKATHLSREVSSLRLFYSDPETLARKDESASVSAPMAEKIGGQVAFTGGHWCRPDYRSKGLTGLTPRIARALAIGRWNIEFACTFMAQDVFERGVAQRAGYPNVEWGIELLNNPFGTLRMALLWNDRAGIVQDIQTHLETLGSAAQSIPAERSA